MPPTCTCCCHPQRGDLDQALVEGGSLRDIARRFHVGKDAVARHRHHVGDLIAADRERRSEELIGHVERLLGRALKLLKRAEAGDDIRAAIGALREARCCVETLMVFHRDADLERRIAALEAASATTANVVSPFGRRSA